MAHDQEFAAHLQTLMTNLADLSDRCKREGTAGMLSRIRDLQQQQSDAVETRELLKSIREDPKKYLTFRVKVF